MNNDVLMPKGNEAELLLMADKLGFKEVIFLYDELGKKPVKGEQGNIKIHTAGLIKTVNKIPKVKKNFDYVFALATRVFFENRQVRYLIDAETDSKEDLLYQKRAGLDDIMCRLAEEKNKVIVFNAKLLTQTNLNINILGRLLQNSRLCRKHKVKTMVATFATSPLEMRAPKDLDGFARVLKLL